MEKRIFSFDILRAMLVFWIVFCWHFANYNLADFVPSQLPFHRLTNGVLAAFMFLSGLFTSSAKIANMSMMKHYYVRRFKRFYLLYAVAALSLFFIHYPFVEGFFTGGLEQLFLSLLGISTLTHHAPSTLWFMDLLLFFIWITPLILSCKNKYVIAFVIWFFFFLLQRLYPLDSRLVNYMPFYFAGLFLPSTCMCLNVYKSIICLLISILVLFIPFDHYMFLYILNGAIVLGLIGLSNILGRFILQQGFIGKYVILTLSYSSMVMYFFHRQFYALCHIMDIPVIL